MACTKTFSWKLSAYVFLTVVGLDVALFVLDGLTYGSLSVQLAWWIINFPGFPLFNLLLPRMAGWSSVLIVGGGLLSAFIWSILAGCFFRREHALKIAISAPVVLISFYIGTFSCCWFLSPSSVGSWQGRKVHSVAFQTGIDRKIWDPAFWFVEHVCGYENYESAGGIESSIFVFTKFLDLPKSEAVRKP